MDVSDAERVFTARVNERLRALGLTQTDLADRLEIGRQAVNNWIGPTKKVPLKNALAIARALGTSVSYLFGETVDPSPVSPDRQSIALGVIAELRSNIDRIEKKLLVSLQAKGFEAQQRSRTSQHEPNQDGPAPSPPQLDTGHAAAP